MAHMLYLTVILDITTLPRISTMYESNIINGPFWTICSRPILDHFGQIIDKHRLTNNYIKKSYKKSHDMLPDLLPIQPFGRADIRCGVASLYKQKQTCRLLQMHTMGSSGG